jgi:hypothetical protein
LRPAFCLRQHFLENLGLVHGIAQGVMGQLALS